jgi:glycosyltransferase involved in cell wall biosynthesis
VRVLIFHGYLLAGTGSNVYNARLAEALKRLGHDVQLLCQDRHPADHGFIDAAGDWDSGRLRVCLLRERAGVPSQGGRCTVYRPDIGPLLPVYVADRYEGIQARTFADCSEFEVDRYVERNVAAVREVVARARPDVALANHLVMGPVILARALGGEIPYAVKVHGSALEYTVKPQPERFLAPAIEGLGAASAVLVGSRHTAESLWQTIADPALEAGTRLGPPGVDVERFAPREPDAAGAGVRGLVGHLRELPTPRAGAARSAFARDPHAAADALERVQPGADRVVSFVGKLIVSKGVDLLLAAWPLVTAAQPAARLVIVGFGAYRQALERLRDALADGDLDAAEALALAGRALEADGDETDAQPTAGGAAGEHRARGAEHAGQARQAPLAHLLAFLRSLRDVERQSYLRAAASMRERVLFTGRLEHEELAELLPACEALVVPSTFPEAFGMVAAEAAACGAFPVSAAHSGLREVSDALSEAVPADVARWLSFPVDDDAVRALAANVAGWLAVAPEVREQTRNGLVETVRRLWSWEGVARGVLAAARGELAALRDV